jgi:leucyl aminopeptidase (aminopeptidase T)
MMNLRDMQAGATCLLVDCGKLAAHERVTIVCDPSTRQVATIVHEVAKSISGTVNLLESPELDMHGQEPPDEIARAMLHCDLLIGLTSKSMAHTAARRNATDQGARYLSLPDYSLNLLADPSLQADYDWGADMARYVSDAFTKGSTAHVTTPNGTDVTLDISGRTGNCCPGIVQKAGDLGSPPDIEANVSPIESASKGIVVVDGSIPFPGFGLLDAPITLTIEDGAIRDFHGDAKIVEKLMRLFDSQDSKKTRVLAECGVGLNPKATLTGVMLTDEGAYGTMHFGFGSNATVGGLNDVAFHLDFVFRQPSLAIDGQKLIVDGKVQK